MVMIPLVLSATTHIWNSSGFPSLHPDEGTYLSESISLLRGESLEETLGNRGRHPYGNPFFGDLFLAGLLGVSGYEADLANPTASFEYVQQLYVIPRMLMGLLSVVDTFLVFKITERRYDRRVAFIASILFAVMPVGWLTRRIFLESLQLPLILSSILFALYARNPNKDDADYNRSKRRSFIILSGMFLGIAIFTKIPAFCLIPVIGILACAASERKKTIRNLGLWFIPVLIIPAIWPFYAILTNDFDRWTDSVLWQAQRESQPLRTSLNVIFKIDPLMFSLGAEQESFTRR